MSALICPFFFFQAEDGIRDKLVTGVQTCALPISRRGHPDRARGDTDCKGCNSTLILSIVRRSPEKGGEMAEEVAGDEPHQTEIDRQKIGRASCRERV